MNKFCIKIAFSIAISLLGLFSASAQEKIIIVNKGPWQGDNGRLSYFQNGSIVSNQWFRDVNGRKLGDTPDDIIHVRSNLIAIALNGSNMVQFIDAAGKAVGTSGEIPNICKMATDGAYVYVTSYAHECDTQRGMLTFQKGFVAKIESETFRTVDAVEVGYEPEGIALYEGKLFVANSGGYAFQENHDYERTVSVIDAATMAVERTIDTGQINLYGKLSQSGRYLCINSPGDYYQVPAATIIFDCEAAIAGNSDAQCCVKIPYASTYSTTTLDGIFYAVGSVYSYISGGYDYNFLTIDPEAVMASYGRQGVTNSIPTAIMDGINKMVSPSGIYVNPFTGYIYAADAADFASSGSLYQWSPEGNFLGKFGLYIDPEYFLALNPDGEAGIAGILQDQEDDPSAPMYNLQGMPIYNPTPGQVYIQSGKKKLCR